MTVGIVGLGLIGGSLAKAYKRTPEIRVLGTDINRTVTEYALLSGAVDAELSDETIGQCQLLLIAVYPEAAEAYLKQNAPLISHETVVIDCLGTKRAICELGFALAAQYGFTFAGGHPMAGTHNSGFKYSRENLFNGAPMVIVPPRFDDMELLKHIKELLAPVGFGSISVTTAEGHDEMIAFTSQLAHIVSNAYIKSPTAGAHKGFSAGSYKDLTRVAWLEPQMWTELIMENADHVTAELDTLIGNLKQYREAVAQKDAQTLCRLLDEGRMRKKEIDGR